MRRPPIEVNLEEVYRILEAARREPMSDTDYEKVKAAVAALAEKAAPRSRTTEKTRAVLEQKSASEPPPRRRSTRRADTDATAPPGSRPPSGSSSRIPPCSTAMRARSA